eukprot:3403236-Rhodomonas_salina.2
MPGQSRISHCNAGRYPLGQNRTLRSNSGLLTICKYRHCSAALQVLGQSFGAHSDAATSDLSMPDTAHLRLGCRSSGAPPWYHHTRRQPQTADGTRAAGEQSSHLAQLDEAQDRELDTEHVPSAERACQHFSSLLAPCMLRVSLLEPRPVVARSRQEAWR